MAISRWDRFKAWLDEPSPIGARKTRVDVLSDRCEVLTSDVAHLRGVVADQKAYLGMAWERMIEIEKQVSQLRLAMTHREKSAPVAIKARNWREFQKLTEDGELPHAS